MVAFRNSTFAGSTKIKKMTGNAISKRMTAASVSFTAKWVPYPAGRSARAADVGHPRLIRRTAAADVHTSAGCETTIITGQKVDERGYLFRLTYSAHGNPAGHVVNLLLR
jgi:hypothetical protein